MTKLVQEYMYHSQAHKGAFRQWQDRSQKMHLIFKLFRRRDYAPQTERTHGDVQLLAFNGATTGLMQAVTGLSLSSGAMFILLMAVPFVLCMFRSM